MNLKMKAIAAAVAAVGFGSAHAGTDYFQAAGASAFRGAAEGLVVGYCNPGSVFKYVSNVVESVTGSKHSGDVTRIICTSTIPAYTFNATIDFSYDSFGGSWLGFTAANNIAIPSYPTLNIEPIATVALCTTGTTTTVTIAGAAVSQIAGCGEVAPVTPGGATTFGFTDVEPALFFASKTGNQPPAAAAVPFPAALGATYTQVPLLGVTWAVSASKPLWLAMENDQASAGLIPASCAGNLDESNKICAPYITKAQYRSIVQGVGDGDLHYDLVNLFTSTAPTGTLTLERRDEGSGTQAASNAYFLNEGCTSAALSDIQSSVAGGMVVHVNASTGLVKAGLQADTYGIGVFSADNCPAAGTTIAGTTTGSFGCLKLAGGSVSTRTAPQENGAVSFPHSNNVTVGAYDYSSEEQFYVSTGVTAIPGGVNFVTQLMNTTAGYTNTAGFYNLTGLTTAPLTVPTNGTYYRVGAATAGVAHAGGSNMCAGLVDTF